MNKFISYFLNKLKCKSTFFLLPTVILELISLILYLNFGTSLFIPNLSTEVIVFMILGMVLPILVIFSPLKIAYVITYVVNLFACFEYLASQSSFIANVFVGIDGTTFGVYFYVIVLSTLASAVLSLVAMKFVQEPAFYDVKGGDV